ncbi:transcription antitermination factor NusB [Spiroplasma alleghenense]|uniref:Transcription antitermination protein NusB n=1 Tax=Spiroplasma alleghenense TaxID=216931 RepID=A0A345Z3J6_9MOLU|nr:transcription antitermination factor NusB [Spiroplasma alleghenense]AXK51175.1 transcription antitermination protein NusB [Spiroplasma alleghenense]
MEILSTSLTSRRKGLIRIIYRYYILDCNENKIKQEILDNFQLEFDENAIQTTLNLLDKISELETIATDLLSKEWTWSRIPNIFKAIIIVGIFEIKILEVPKAIIINEMVELSRSYQPDLDSKFINAILDKIS